MRPGRVRAADEYEALDAVAELDAFEFTEIVASRELLLPSQLRAGLRAGRLKRVHGLCRLVRRRLAYRSWSKGSTMETVMEDISTGHRVRLPFA